MARVSGPQTLLQAAFVSSSWTVGSSQWNNLDICPSILPVLDAAKRTKRTLEVIIGVVRARSYPQLNTRAHVQTEPKENVFIEIRLQF